MNKHPKGKYTSGDFCCAAWLQANTKHGKERAKAIIRLSMMAPLEIKAAAADVAKTAERIIHKAKAAA